LGAIIRKIWLRNVFILSGGRPGIGKRLCRVASMRGRLGLRLAAQGIILPLQDIASPYLNIVSMAGSRAVRKASPGSGLE